MTTFVIPAEAFPTRARATGHGISAASGKLGAVFGAAVMPAVLHMYKEDASGEGSGSSGNLAGLRAVMIACAGVCLLGLIWTWALTEETGKLTFEQLDSKHKQEQEQEQQEAVVAAVPASSAAPANAATSPSALAVIRP